jgi:HEAT repeat protein
MDPARRTEVMRHLTAATATLDPRVVMQMLSAADDASAAVGVTGAEIRSGIAGAFDDSRVAQLLATTLAIDGQATDRLAGVFDTIAPDVARKRRVLTMTKTLLSDAPLGKGNQFEALWTSMEELLLAYNERPFVSASYRTALDGAAARAAAMAADVPADLAPLIDTLGQDNVRKLSARLLVDLLKLEHDPKRAPELARDVAALAEDLLLAGDYASALTVTDALSEQASTPGAVTQAGSRAALDGLVDTIAFRETADLLGDMTPEDAEMFAALSAAIGPAATDALRHLIAIEAETTARRRASDIIVKYGAAAATRLAPLIDNRDWFARQNVAELLGRIGVPAAVPLLQPLLRGGDPRVMRAAVRALSHIDDPAAARAVHTVLRSASGEHRRAVVAALVEERDPRVAPVLACVLNESDPFGSDHHLVLETLGAMADLGRDEAVPHVARVMRRRSWFARRKTRALKQTSIDTLRRIGSAAAAQALADAAAQGDRLLRKLARAARVVHA